MKKEITKYKECQRAVKRNTCNILGNQLDLEILTENLEELEDFLDFKGIIDLKELLRYQLKKVFKKSKEMSKNTVNIKDTKSSGTKKTKTKY